MIETKLKRCLSLWEIVTYGVGLILGAGIYVLIGSAAGIAGNMLWLSFVCAAIAAGFTAFSYAELAALFPRASAEYVYTRQTFGYEGLAWVVGFIGITLGFTTASAVAIGFGRYVTRFISIDIVLAALALIVLASWLSYRGIKQSARFNALATAIEIGGLLMVILVGGYFIVKGDAHLANLFSPPVDSSSIASQYLPIVSAGALIFFAYMGFEDIANIAEEAKQPSKILPKAFIYSLIISTVIYILVAVVSVSIVPFQELAQAAQPLSLVMEKLVGTTASDIVAAIALFATANTVLITLIVAARMLYGMADQGSLPALLGMVHKTRRTPWIAVIVVAVVTTSFLFFEHVEILASISDVGVFILFFVVNICNIALRFTQPDLSRPWRTPINIGSFPVLSAFGAISCLGMLVTINHPVEIFGTTISSLYIGLLIFSLAIPLYLVIGKKKSPNEEIDPSF